MRHRGNAKFQLALQPAEPNVCRSCGKVVKRMDRHAGSAACAAAGRMAMIRRQGLVEVWHTEKDILERVAIPVVVIRLAGKRRWYASGAAVRAMRLLRYSRVDDQRVSRLLAGAHEELASEVALAVLQLPVDMVRTINETDARAP